MIEENLDILDENLNEFISELFEDTNSLTYGDVAGRINEWNYKINLYQLNKNFDLIQKMFIGSNFPNEINLQSFFVITERSTLKYLITQILFQAKNPLLRRVKEQEANRNRHTNINSNEKRTEKDLDEIFKNAEIKNREFEDSIKKAKKKNDLDNILQDIYSDEEEKKKNLSDNEERKETNGEKKKSPSQKIDFDRDLFENSDKITSSDNMKFEAGPMDETLDFGNVQNIMDNEEDFDLNLDDKMESMTEKSINKREIEKIDKKVDDVFYMVLDRKGLICFNVKSVELVKGSVYVACDECSIPNQVKLQKKYNSSLLGKSKKNIKPKEKFVLFHGKNTCKCSGVVEIFIKMGTILEKKKITLFFMIIINLIDKIK